MMKRFIGVVLLVAIITMYIIHPYYHSVSPLVYDIVWYIIGILGAWVSLKIIIK